MNLEEKFINQINHSQRIVVFTGAGLSTRSGIPDFRSAAGLFDQLTGEWYSGEDALSSWFLQQYPVLFHQNFHEKLSFPNAKPNSGHQFIAMLEKLGKEVTVVTQNIDNLHQEAGSQTVLELHGNGTRYRCSVCGQIAKEDDMFIGEDGVPYHAAPLDEIHERGEAMMRPDIVLYGEELDPVVVKRTTQAMMEADLLIVVGTSLNVFPAANFLNYFSGRFFTLINKEEVPHMHRFNLVVQEDATSFMERAWELGFSQIK